MFLYHVLTDAGADVIMDRNAADPSSGFDHDEVHAHTSGDRIIRKVGVRFTNQILLEGRRVEELPPGWSAIAIEAPDSDVEQWEFFAAEDHRVFIIPSRDANPLISMVKYGRRSSAI